MKQIVLLWRNLLNIIPRASQSIPRSKIYRICLIWIAKAIPDYPQSVPEHSPTIPRLSPERPRLSPDEPETMKKDAYMKKCIFGKHLLRISDVFLPISSQNYAQKLIVVSKKAWPCRQIRPDPSKIASRIRTLFTILEKG